MFTVEYTFSFRDRKKGTEIIEFFGIIPEGIESNSFSIDFENNEASEEIIEDIEERFETEEIEVEIVRTEIN